MSPERFAMKLQKLRKSKGLTQAALAAKAGISREYLENTLGIKVA